MPCLQRAGMKQVRVRVVFRPLQPREQLRLTSLPCHCRLNGGVCVCVCPISCPSPIPQQPEPGGLQAPSEAGAGPGVLCGELERPSHVTSQEMAGGTGIGQGQPAPGTATDHPCPEFLLSAAEPTARPRSTRDMEKRTKPAFTQPGGGHGKSSGCTVAKTWGPQGRWLPPRRPEHGALMPRPLPDTTSRSRVPFSASPQEETWEENLRFLSLQV